MNHSMSLMEKVLDYWFTIEFLSQDSYPINNDKIRRFQKYKANYRQTKKQYDSIELVFVSNIGQIHKQPIEIVAEEAASCGMESWGNTTVYIGKMKREKCIECIADALPSDAGEERPEKAVGEIAWASLQLSPKGEYVEHSLSLSPLIWSLNQIRSARMPVSQVLSTDEYECDINDLCKNFFDKETEDHSEIISFKTLRKLFFIIEKKFVKENIVNTDTSAYEEIYGLETTLFRNEEVRAKKEENNYAGLSRSYYADDIEMLSDFEKRNAIKSDLRDYIEVLGAEEWEKSKRIDLVKPTEPESGKYLQQMNEILLPQNAPLGKWPSRFMPALMQQMAINLAIRKGRTKLFHLNGDIFSVNGPPGTGKTTLLKEIIVSNVVERAILLTQWSDPDDAFGANAFLNGDGPQNAYSRYTRKWYCLKDDRINNYGTLVASCNNAAVENISKELPKTMAGDLLPLESDSQELRDALQEVGRLFCPEDSDVEETSGEGEPYRDIYFSMYARKLLNDDEAWGLIAVPLGKKSNIQSFYRNVLYPLARDFYRNEQIEKRKKRYSAAKKAFEAQLQVVLSVQKLLNKEGDLLQKKINAQYAAQDIFEEKNRLIQGYRVQLKEMAEQYEKRQHIADRHRSMLLECGQEMDQLRRKIEEKEYERSAYCQKKKEYQARKDEAFKNTGIFVKFFNKTKYDDSLKRIEEYDLDIEKINVDIARIEIERMQLKEQFKEAESQYHLQRCRQDAIIAEQTVLKERMRGIQTDIEECEHEILRAEAVRKEAKEEYEQEVKINAERNGFDRRIALDEQFVSRMLSDNIDEATQAQVDNPWFTQHYNREREKLFGLAMRLNKEFVLSSKCCRDNFVTLSQYWGLRMGDEGERIDFHQKDRKKMVGALYQTLFLLVPVFSSTFASVRRLFRDVQTPDVFGTLIVDEAGQAQPQMAVGALFRCRRAVVVGDPKQVEPVVTEDLALLRRLNSDEALKPYRSKTLSVQGFADGLNRFGTYLDGDAGYSEWVGCPLLVHRRCISPMYDISNIISYNGIMKQQTHLPKHETADMFISSRSQWVNVIGQEVGKKNHFVEAQGKKVCELLEIAFSKNSKPDIFIISPFTTVVSGIKTYINEYCKRQKDTKIDAEYLLNDTQKKIGTVHTFQGKEANEVIFLLGCDRSEGAKGAIRWVNANIINVAATRAKYRLYVLGDEKAWEISDRVSQMREIIQTHAIKSIKKILDSKMEEDERNVALAEMSKALPPLSSFSVTVESDEGEKKGFSIETEGLIHGLNDEFIHSELTETQLRIFGFQSCKDLDRFSLGVKRNLWLGIKLYYLLRPVYRINKYLDASCCAILFCKALELHMKDCFMVNLKNMFPKQSMRGFGANRQHIALEEARDNEFTLGAVTRLIHNNCNELEQSMKACGKTEYDEKWWTAFAERLRRCTKKRNECCHSGLFRWRDQADLLNEMFGAGEMDSKNGEIGIGGLVFAGEVGKLLGGR